MGGVGRAAALTARGEWAGSVVGDEETTRRRRVGDADALGLAGYALDVVEACLYDDSPRVRRAAALLVCDVDGGCLCT